MTHFLVQFAQKLDPNALNIPPLTGDQVLQNGLNLAYFVMAIIAVIVIIVAGIMYATSGGDSAAVTKAKNLILYSVVGIVVILAAWGITNFVIGRF
jgi:hypothetical protein